MTSGYPRTKYLTTLEHSTYPLYYTAYTRRVCVQLVVRFAVKILLCVYNYGRSASWLSYTVNCSIVFFIIQIVNSILILVSAAKLSCGKNVLRKVHSASHFSTGFSGCAPSLHVASSFEFYLVAPWCIAESVWLKISKEKGINWITIWIKRYWR